ncbi:hypothetical protein BH23ACT9_BH23ACT9_08580 [soil metagenome]
MATTHTATLRVPVQLRDEIAQLADERGTTMLDVVTDAIHRLRRDQWWDAVHDAIEDMSPDDQAGYQADAESMGTAARDGLHGR